MIGLYYLSVVVLWCWLTWLLLRLGWRVVRRNKKKLTTGNVVVSLSILVWLSASLWFGGGCKIYYDAKVRELCARDGGVRVYETVELPPERFNKWGQPNFYKPDQGENALGPEYMFKRDIQYFYGWVTLTRFHIKVRRRSDGKLLGETILYKRSGGDMPGPGHSSSYICPENAAGINLLTSLFVNLDREK